MSVYTCSICGYIYNQKLGDPDGGIAPGTPFADIPDDWVCPICKKPKSFFRETPEQDYSYQSIDDADMDELLLK
jgi:rubredoxin